MNKSKIIHFANAAFFTALIFVGTQFLKVPFPFGYGHLGDCFVLMAGAFVGSPYAIIAAAAGSVLADCLSGYAIYVPATLIVKSTMTVIVLLVMKSHKNAEFSVCRFALGAILAEMVMVAGYFLYDTLLYGVSGALASIVGNAAQGVMAVVSATALVSVIRHSSLRKYI